MTNSSRSTIFFFYYFNQYCFYANIYKWQKILFRMPDDDFFFCSDKNSPKCLPSNSVLRRKSFNYRFQKYVLAGSQWNDCYGVIYLLTDNNIDGFWKHRMFYVGQTVQELRSRFRQHLNYPNFLLEIALNRYGKSFNIREITSEHLQTYGGEFSIQVIGKAYNDEELNHLEIQEIKNYQSCYLDYFTVDQSGSIIPLYGFNIERGGMQKRAYLYGPLSPVYIDIDPDHLKHLISLGMTANEMQEELGVSESTLRERIREFWGYDGFNEARKYLGSYELFRKRVNKRRSDNQLEDKQLDELEKLLIQGHMLHEIAEKLKISTKTIYNWLGDLGYDNLTEAYEDLGSVEIHAQRENAYRSNSRARGADLPHYIELEKAQITAMIKAGLSVKEMVKELSKQGVEIAENTLGRKIQESFGFMYRDLHKIIFLYPKLDRYLGVNHLKSLLQEGFSGDEILKFYLEVLIAKGLSLNEISQLYGLANSSSLSYWLKKLNTSYREMKYKFFYKPRIIRSLQSGISSIEEMTKFFPDTGVKQLTSAIKYNWEEELKMFNNDTRSLMRYISDIYRK